MYNLIRAENWRTKYCDEPHLVIAVDGIALDELIADNTRNQSYLGLIPAWSDGLYDENERKVVWNRIQCDPMKNTIVPVLMCPDDLDFWCTIIVADTTFDLDKVTWHAIGIDVSGSVGLPESIGSSVNWLDGLGPFYFSRHDYDECVAKFRLRLSQTNSG